MGLLNLFIKVDASIDLSLRGLENAAAVEQWKLACKLLTSLSAWYGTSPLMFSLNLNDYCSGYRQLTPYVPVLITLLAVKVEIVPDPS